MSRPRRITDEQLQAVRESQLRRRALLAELRALPTLRQHARELYCTERHLWRALQEQKPQKDNAAMTMKEFVAWRRSIALSQSS